MIYLLAITINQQGTREGWLGEVAEWLQASARIIKMVAAEEVGETGTRHLQVSAETNVGPQQMRNDITSHFMELRGEKSKKGQKMSIATMRKSWERNVAYCLKEYGVRYTKGCTDEEVLHWRDTGVSEAKRKKEDTPSWNQQLCNASVKARARDDSEIGEVIVKKYIEIKKTIPDRFQLARLIETVDLLCATEHRREEMIRTIVRQATEVKNRML